MPAVLVTKPMQRALSFCVVAALAPAGCLDGVGADEGGSGGDPVPSEIITTVTLRFVPQAGGDAIVAAFSDPDGDGGVSGSADPIVLTVGTSYDLDVSFTNTLVDPPEDISAEVAAEAEEHQIFVTGTGVSGPAAGNDPSALVLHAYADVESDYGPNATGEDLPVGLAGTITAAAVGTGSLGVRLQHLPELNGAPQKVADLAASVAMGEVLPGDVDAAVSFDLTVQ